MKIHNTGGIPDVLVNDRHAARLFRDRDQGGSVEISSNLRGYEESGIPMGLEGD
jgi:hypothetical protein